MHSLIFSWYKAFGIDWNHPGKSKTTGDEFSGLVFKAWEIEKQKAVVSFHWKGRLACGDRFCASGLREDFRPGPLDGSSFSLHAEPLRTPPPHRHKLTQNVKHLEDFCHFLQLIQERESFANWWPTIPSQIVSVNGDNTEIKCDFCPELLWPLFIFNLNIGGR